MDKEKKYIDNCPIFNPLSDHTEYFGMEQYSNLWNGNWSITNKQRVVDPIFNDKNSKYNIYTFGCSWTYGSGDVSQEETFTHLIGNSETSVWNYGMPGASFDYINLITSRVYKDLNCDMNNKLFIITLPYIGRRGWFSKDGTFYSNIVDALSGVHPDDNWVENNYDVDHMLNDYNIYYYFLRHYEMMNNYIGKNNIIWSSWGSDKENSRSFSWVQTIKNKMDISFDVYDYSNDNIHPGPISNKKYSDKLKDMIKKRFYD